MFSVMLIMAALAAGGDEWEIPSALETINDTGELAFSDGSSLYQFFDDGRFLLEPLSRCGRAIEGEWECSDSGTFVITGIWTWYDGISRVNDVRRMTINITVLSDKPDTLESLWQGTGSTVYNVYFTMEELVSLDVIPEQ